MVRLPGFTGSDAGVFVEGAYTTNTLPDPESTVGLSLISRRDLLRMGASAGLAGVTGVLSAGVGRAPRITGFVERDGAHLQLDDSRYSFRGTNNFWLTEPHTTRGTVDALVRNASGLGFNAVRTWGFCEGMEGRCLQPGPGRYSEWAFRRMDYVVYAAGRRGLRLVIPFTDNWSHYGGMESYVEWSPTAETHDDFYTDPTCRRLYRDYVRYFLNRRNQYTGRRYKDDPAVMAWELANEPHAETAGVEVLQDWITDMSAFVKEIDSNHLVSTGLEGFYSRSGDWKYDGSMGTDFVRNHEPSTVDLCSFHLYPDHYDMTPEESVRWIRRHVRDAQRLGKPVYLGEYGLRDRSMRPHVFGRWLQDLERLDADGALLWQLVRRERGDADGFSVYVEDEETVSRIRGHSGSRAT